MRVLTYDTESNGLLEEATTIHCAVTKIGDVLTTYDPSTVRNFITDLSNLSSDTIICAHNQITHDLPLMEKIYGYRHRGKVLDTLVLSRLLNPERVGRHGLEAWGERLGRSKPDHEDWENYTPELLHRCSEDVEINELVLHELLREGGIDAEELASLPSY